MTKNNYNGWSNYETWNLSLWIDNDRNWYREVNDKASALVCDVLTKDEQIENLRKFIMDLVDEDAPTMDPSFFTDVMNASIREVNFREISRSIIEEARRGRAQDLKEDRQSA